MAVCLAGLLCPIMAVKAQWVTFDPSNFAQSIVNTTRNVVQTTTTAENMVKNFQETVKIYEQGKRYYDALKAVNNLVKDARKVQQTVLLVGEISDIYVNSFQKMLTDENYTPDELSAIRLAYPEEETFRGACRAYAREKSDDIAARLRALFAYFYYLRDLSCVAGAEEVLTRLFSDCGAEAGLLARKTGKECLKRLHYFLSFASEPAPLSVHEFLAKLQLMKGEIMYEENAGENVVKILTMHSSKGLEYPVVILGDACDPFRGKNDRG